MPSIWPVMNSASPKNIAVGISCRNVRWFENVFGGQFILLVLNRAKQVVRRRARFTFVDIGRDVAAPVVVVPLNPRRRAAVYVT